MERRRVLLPANKLRGVLQNLLWKNAGAGRPVDLGARAMVFSPHFDDETLGCGGTIVKKKRAGADVRIVFMTDGSASHRHLMPGAELATIRSAEALAACRVLGVQQEHVTLLNFEDGGLRKAYEPAKARVIELLRDVEPNEIFVPYRKEQPSDHLATTDIVLSAVREWRRGKPGKVTIFEYPVWFWYHWPWVSADTGTGRAYTGWASGALTGSLALIRELRSRIFVGDVLGIKHAALNEHRSQMVRLLPNPQWFTLGDVGNGDFLACFFRDHELFRCYSIGA
jgi:LmbE family N-acetylglucosaminyl deacetylase